MCCFGVFSAWFKWNPACQVELSSILKPARAQLFSWWLLHAAVFFSLPPHQLQVAGRVFHAGGGSSKHSPGGQTRSSHAIRKSPDPAVWLMWGFNGSIIRSGPQRYLTPASSAVLQGPFLRCSSTLVPFSKKTTLSSQQLELFHHAYSFTSENKWSGAQHVWPVFHYFFGCMPPNLLPHWKWCPWETCLVS